MTIREKTGSVFALLVITSLALFIFLGSRGLNEPDEGRYAELGREMLATGDWIIPHLNSFPHFQKPPMLYWATATGLSVLGVNEWGARLPSALAGLGVILLTLRLGWRLGDFRHGLAAAFILLSSVEFFGLARLLTPDMLMTFWITLAIVGLVEHQATGSWWSRGLFFLSMGLGFMTKGPMAFVIPLSAALAMGGKNSRLTPSRWAVGMLLALGVGLSWFLVVSLRHHELFNYFLGYELVERFASATHGRSRPFWFFLPVLIGGFLPWTFFLPPVVASAVARWRAVRPLSWKERLLIGWALPPFLILSISGSKLPTYILPLFPALALGVAFWWMRTQEGHSRKIGMACCMLLFASLPVITLVAPHLMPLAIAPHFASKFLAIFGIVSLIGTMLLLGVTGKLDGLTGVFPLAGFSLIIWVMLCTQTDSVNRLLSQQATVRPLAERYLELTQGEQTPLFVCNARAHGFEFYTQRMVGVSIEEAALVLTPSAENAARLYSSSKKCAHVFKTVPDAWGVIRSDNYGEHFLPANWVIEGRSGDFLLIRNRAGLATTGS